MVNKCKGSNIMKIQRIAIDGFKNLCDVDISFSKITALVALNNFGKSNFLTGIDFGLKFIHGNKEKRKNMLSSARFIPINRGSINKHFSFEIEAVTTIKNIPYRTVYGYSCNWITNDEDPLEILTEYLKIKIDEKGQKYNQFINRKKENALYKSSETGRCSVTTQIENDELVINKLRAFDQLYYIDVVKRINDLRLYNENNLDAKEFYVPDPIIQKGIVDSIIDSTNLPRVIARLKQLNPDKYELLLDAYKQLFPNIQDVIVKELQFNRDGDLRIPDDAPFIVTNSVYLLFVDDKTLSKLIDFESMSDGAKRVFMILTKIVMASISEKSISLIAIEEPENSVHPSLFKAYLQIIEELLEDCKVIITSHSPYVISFLELEDIYVGLHNDGGIATFSGFKKTRIKTLMEDAASVDMSIGDYIFTLLTDEENEMKKYLECGMDE